MSERTARDIGIRLGVLALAFSLATACFLWFEAPGPVERYAPEGAGDELVAALEEGWRPVPPRRDR